MPGRTALVTGGAKRIGRAICIALANDGYDIIVHCNNSIEDAKQVVSDINKIGQSAIIVQGDLCSDIESICHQVSDAEIITRRGGLDVLVNSASIFERSEFEKINQNDVDRMFSINTIAPFMLIRNLLTDIRSVNGCIINILDISIARPLPFYSHYCASKSALNSLTLSLATELAPTVRVNGVAPGAIMFSDIETAEYRDQILSQIPMGRTGTAEEIAQTVLFLANGPQYITGHVISVDGGLGLTGP